MERLTDIIKLRRPFPILGTGDLIRMYLRSSICCCCRKRSCFSKKSNHEGRLFAIGSKKLAKELDVLEILSSLRQQKIFFRASLNTAQKDLIKL